MRAAFSEFMDIQGLCRKIKQALNAFVNPR